MSTCVSGAFELKTEWNGGFDLDAIIDLLVPLRVPLGDLLFKHFNCMEPSTLVSDTSGSNEMIYFEIKECIIVPGVFIGGSGDLLFLSDVFGLFP